MKANLIYWTFGGKSNSKINVKNVQIHQNTWFIGSSELPFAGVTPSCVWVHFQLSTSSIYGKNCQGHTLLSLVGSISVAIEETFDRVSSTWSKSQCQKELIHGCVVYRFQSIVVLEVSKIIRQTVTKSLTEKSSKYPISSCSGLVMAQSRRCQNPSQWIKPLSKSKRKI